MFTIGGSAARSDRNSITQPIQYDRALLATTAGSRNLRKIRGTYCCDRLWRVQKKTRPSHRGNPGLSYPSQPAVPELPQPSQHPPPPRNPGQPICPKKFPTLLISHGNPKAVFPCVFQLFRRHRPQKIIDLSMLVCIGKAMKPKKKLNTMSCKASFQAPSGGGLVSLHSAHGEKAFPHSNFPVFFYVSMRNSSRKRLGQ